MPIVVTVGNKSRVNVSVQSPVVAVMVLSGELKVWEWYEGGMILFDCLERQGWREGGGFGSASQHVGS